MKTFEREDSTGSGEKQRIEPSAIAIGNHPVE
jgi:hypothetical protein